MHAQDMTETPVDNPLRIFFMAAGSIACFSIMNAFVKLSAVDYSIPQMIFFRNFFAFFPIAFIVWRMGGLKLLRTERVGAHAWRGIVGVLGMCFFFMSFALLPLADATAIHFASPLILTALSVPMLGERVGKHRWTAIIVGLCAVVFMIRPEGGNMAGSLIAFGAAFLGALAMIFVRRLGRTEHTLAIVFYFTLFGTILGGIGMMFMWQPLKAETMHYLILTGLLGGLAQIMLTYAYSKAPAAYVASFSYLSMIFAVGLDVLVWAKWPDWHISVGSLVIMASGLYIVYREAQKKKQLSVATNVYSVPPALPTEKDPV